ncbi:hypothetical protein BGX21_004796 [Mortierella sp. AD011]|nr:hypothetical protein BGX20_004717 [Mortierella sp. AD010]KAF9372413.1 hypothetical protein BGX21_004796 [Mortierella sp. AD011]
MLPLVITSHDNTPTMMEELLVAMEQRLNKALDTRLAELQQNNHSFSEDSSDDNDPSDQRFVPAKLADTFYPLEDQKRKFPDMYPDDPQNLFDHEPLSERSLP